MVSRFLKAAPLRLRFALANLRPLPLLAFVLVLAVVVCQVVLMPSRERALAEAEESLTQSERAVRRQQIARQEQAASPAEARQRLLDRFPGEQGLNAELGRVLELAGTHGLTLPEGEYRLVAGKDGLFDRYVLNLPVSGGYQAIRGYARAIRQEFPEMAIDDLTIRRPNIGAGQVDAQLRLILFARKGAA
jgi:hypothetical protein